MPSPRLLRKAALSAAAAALASLPAAAGAQGLALSRFDPAERGSRFFVADSLELDERTRLAAGVVTAWSRNLQTDPRSRLVEDRLAMHPGASVAIAPGARFGLDLPVAVAQSGRATVLDGRLVGAPGSPRLGDLRASFDLRFTGPPSDHDGVSVAGGVSAYLPTGSQADLTSDDHVRVGVRLASALRAGWLVAALRVGYMYRHELPRFAGVALGSEANAAAALGLRAGSVTIGPEVHGSTILRSAAFEAKSTPVEGLFGAHVDVGPVRAGVAAGTYLVGGLGASPARFVFSLEWLPQAVLAPPDRDGDGVPDADDACPDVAGPASASAGARGCPAPPRDNDADGIVDAEDACPRLAGLRSSDPMIHGCPDRDHDGVPDPVDACPDVHGDRSVLPRFHGCPSDLDGDGVPDSRDACPEVPGDETDDLRTSGCPPPPPPPPDRDGDGVEDAEDACPDERGVETEDPATNGCPLVRVEGDRLRLARPLAFDGGQPTLSAEGERVAAAVASFLVAHPEIGRVRVEAHSDDRSARASRWTEEQARAVAARLVALGVARRRVEARGLGGTRPVASSETPEGRARNRRIELVLLPARR